MTVKIVDAKGSVIPVGMKGQKGLDYLKILQVKGTLKRDAAGNVTVEAGQFAVRAE